MASCFVNNNKCFCFSCWSGLSIVIGWGELVLARVLVRNLWVFPLDLNTIFFPEIWINKITEKEFSTLGFIFFYSSNPTSFLHSIHSWIYKRRSLYNSPPNSFPPQLNQYQLVLLVSHPFKLSHISAVHLLKSLTKHLKSGQWEYLLSLAVIIQTPQTVFSSFFSTCWCYSRGIQSASPNLCIILSLSSIYSLMHSLKRTGGLKVGFGCGVGSQRGIYSPPFLNKMCGLQVWPSVDATDPVLSFFSSFRPFWKANMTYRHSGKNFLPVYFFLIWCKMFL